MKNAFSRLHTAGVLAGAGLLMGVPLRCTITPVPTPSGSTYYVSCDSGSDSANGQSPSDAWRTIDRGNDADLRPGDNLMLKSGCTWNGQRLDARWNGTSADPITIGAYGDGAWPKIGNGGNADVKIGGSYLIVQNIQTDFGIVASTTCGQPIGQYFGFLFTDGAHDNVLRRSLATHATAGVHLAANSHDNTITENYLVRNDVMTTFGSDPSKDLGAWGVLIHSDNNDIAYNVFRDNKARCTNQGYKLMSNSLEIYEGQGNRIHHNRSSGDRVFTELGGSPAKRSADNQFAYNLFETDLAESRFIVTRGSENSFGPVYRTTISHNTTYQTGQGSEGVMCASGCTPNIMTLEGNVLFAQEKAVYADGPFTMGTNLAWNSAGVPFVQITSNWTGLGYNAGVIIDSPAFVEPGAGDYRLRPSSVAINAAGTRAPYSFDLDYRLVPSDGAPDLGAFEN